MPLFYKEATCKSSTKEGLLYAPDPKKCKKGMLSDQLWLLHVTSMALLCRWGWKSLKDMTSFRNDFETHAILQRYVKDPAAKDFVARKARTITLSKGQGTQQLTLFTSLEIPWGFHTQAVLRNLARPRSLKKVSVWGFYWVRKVWFAFSPTDVCTRNLWQKAERGKITGSESTSRFPQASCFEKPMGYVPEIWGCMYDVLAWSANGTRNRTRHWIPVQPRKVQRN
jgi:hypothetical protein